jgi:hypothetical protein
VLASLELPTYITTTYNRLIANALRNAGKQPVEVLCPWFWPSGIQPADDDPLVQQAAQLGFHFSLPDRYQPEPEHPLVYYLYGQLSLPDTMVLKEDDYFDFLIRISRTPNLIPNFVRATLVRSGLLLLGFQLEDWSFRALVRTILSAGGKGMLDRHVHISAQIQPVEGQMLQPQGAQRYLEEYFSRKSEFFQDIDTEISIYWGSTNDFVRSLRRRWEARGL